MGEDPSGLQHLVYSDADSEPTRVDILPADAKGTVCGACEVEYDWWCHRTGRARLTPLQDWLVARLKSNLRRVKRGESIIRCEARSGGNNSEVTWQCRQLASARRDGRAVCWTHKTKQVIAYISQPAADPYAVLRWLIGAVASDEQVRQAILDGLAGDSKKDDPPTTVPAACVSPAPSPAALAHSVPAVAHMLECSKATVWRMIAKKQLPVIHVGPSGGLTRIPDEALQALLKTGVAS